MLGLVDRSDEVVIGMTERVVKARIVHRRGDAAYAKSISEVPWQPNPVEAADVEPLCMAQARIVSGVARGGEARLVGSRTTVCGSCCEQRKRSTCGEQREERQIQHGREAEWRCTVD